MEDVVLASCDREQKTKAEVMDSFNDEKEPQSPSNAQRNLPYVPRI